MTSTFEYLTAEVSASAVADNLRLIRGRLKPGTKLCAVVKADCYGLSVDLLLETIARGADALAVAAPAEALHVRDLGYEGPLLVLFSCSAYPPGERRGAIEELLRRRVTLTVASPNDIPPIAEAASALPLPKRSVPPPSAVPPPSVLAWGWGSTGSSLPSGSGSTPKPARTRLGGGTSASEVKASVHIKVDSGMGRSGVQPHQAAATAQAVLDSPGLTLTGMYTHFATADDPDPSCMRQQLRRFLDAASSLPGRFRRFDCAHRKRGESSRDRLTLHAANSAATLAEPQAHLDMVRCGLAVYGYQPFDFPQCPDLLRPQELRPALRVWGRLMGVKELPAGATVGYGRQCTLARPSTVGLLPIGYGDGYFRCLGNKATMRIANRDVPVLGRVSMDQVVIDLTDVPRAAPGDVVEIISPLQGAPHGVANLARLACTIPYEVTCRLGRRVRRVLVP